MILITGAAGFIGSALVHELNQQGIDRLTLVDHLGSSQKWQNLKGLKYVDYIPREHLISALMKGLKVSKMVHLGACSSTTESNLDYLIPNNFEYSKVLLKHCLLKKIPFVYASSAATYGNGKQGFSDQTPPSELSPLNAYGFSKNLFDQYVLQNALNDRACGLKFFNVFGPNEAHKGSMASMVYHAYHQIKTSQSVKLFKSNHPDYEDGCQLRDFIYVKDVARLIRLFLSSFRGGIFNVGTGQAHTWLDLIYPIFESLNLPQKIEFIDMPEMLKDKYQYFTQADMSHCPFPFHYTSIRDAVRETVNNHLEPNKNISGCNFS